jgi:hypothetical protein
MLGLWMTPSERRNRIRISGDNIGLSGMGTFNIAGRTFRGSNIMITNDRIVIDGKDVTDEYDIRPAGILEIKVLEGTIHALTTDAAVTCNDVTGDVDAGGSVSCKAVGGSVDAGGSVNCGNVAGSVNAGGSVNCGTVGGSIDAGGSVRHG